MSDTKANYRRSIAKYQKLVQTIAWQNMTHLMPTNRILETIGNYHKLLGNYRKLSHTIGQSVGSDYNPILFSYWNYQSGIITIGKDMFDPK